MFRILVGFALAVCVAQVASTPRRSKASNTPAANEAKEVVDRVLISNPIIDGHNDIGMSFRALTQNRIGGVDLNEDLTNDPFWSQINTTTTDFVRMRKGGLGGQFWSIYAACSTAMKDAVPQTLETIDLIKRLNRKYSDTLHAATSVADIEEAFRLGKIASLMGVEGGHLIQSNYGILRMYYQLGARYLTLTHSCNTPWADSSPTEAKVTDGSHLLAEQGKEGLSKWGMGVVDELNRLGMIVDIAHTSATVMRSVLHRTQAPPMFSHAASRAVYNHHRNVPDDVLHLLKKKGGILMVAVYPVFLANGTATLTDVVNHINHIKEVCGAECVGIGGDYDGVPDRAKGLEDVSKTRKILEALYLTGWSEEDLAKIASRNIMRVLKKAEEVRDSLKGMEPVEEPHPVSKGYNNQAVSDKFFK